MTNDVHDTSSTSPAISSDSATAQTTATALSALENARTALQEINDVLGTLNADLENARTAADEAKRKRGGIAYAAARGNPNAKDALARYTTEQEEAERDAANLALAVADAERQRGEADTAVYAALADLSQAKAQEIGADIIDQSREIDRGIQAVIQMMTRREALYDALQRTDAILPPRVDTRMNEMALGIAFAAAVQREYGQYETQQRIFPSLVYYRSYAKSLEDQDGFHLGKIRRPNPDAAQRKHTPTAAPGSRDPANIPGILRGTYQDDTGSMVARGDHRDWVRISEEGQAPVYEHTPSYGGHPIRTFQDPADTPNFGPRRLASPSGYTPPKEGDSPAQMAPGTKRPVTRKPVSGPASETEANGNVSEE